MSHGEWKEVRVWTVPEAEEAVGNFLFEIGSSGLCTMRSRAGLAEIRGFFQGATSSQVVHALEQYLQELQTLYPKVSGSKIQVEALQEKDWSQEWRRHFRPMAVGKDWLVRPSWGEDDSHGRKSLVIDPGMAFGTGSHPTTRGCLEAMEKIPSDRVDAALDIGTGSGILAIALAALGTRKVLAIDTDPLAIEAARYNVERNGCTGVVEVSEMPLKEIQERFSIVVANLYANLLIDLRRDLLHCLRRSGFLVLSGILARQSTGVIGAYTLLGLPCVWTIRIHGWETLIFTRARSSHAPVLRP
jgi:ribosomal protein L11 methyltransferase